MTLQRKTPLVKPFFRDTAPKPVKEPKRRTRKCAICREQFEPRSMTHKCCTPQCATALVEKEKASKLRKERQEGLAKLKKRADYFKETQVALNKWIREVRDAGKPCISCGRHHEGQNHAGHYLSRGSHPHLALVEANIALQCMPCNVHLSGNQLQFRRGLIERIGLEAVEALESDQVARRYTIDELKALKAEYQRRIKEKRNG